MPELSNNLLLFGLWIALGGVTVALLVLMQTRWGRSQPIRKCLILSVLAHIIFAGYATTVKIVTATPAVAQEESIVRVRILDPAPENHVEVDAASSPKKLWDRFAFEPTERLPKDLANEKTRPELSKRPRPVDDQTVPRLSLSDRLPDLEEKFDELSPARKTGLQANIAQLKPTELKDRPVRPIHVEVKKPSPLLSLPRPTRKNHSNQTLDGPSIESNQTGSPIARNENLLPLPQLDSMLFREKVGQLLPGPIDMPTTAGLGTPAPNSHEMTVMEIGGPKAVATTGDNAKIEKQQPDRTSTEEPGAEPPQLYRLRTAPDRLAQAIAGGATAETEKAVSAALDWLAKNQMADGGWAPDRFGAGIEQKIDGQDRQGAGGQADTGIAGLAILCFLARGETDRSGRYQVTVKRGLDYIISHQKPNGSLSGNASLFAAMYCHAMATLAISEDYCLTHDRRLLEPLGRAIGYTVASQDPKGGGWRYNPADIGDTSQLGWQLMALKSAELAGIEIPEKTVKQIYYFLNRVSSGQFSGLTAYQIGRTPSRSMTAEALSCRIFLGMPAESPTASEAANFLLEELPGEKRPNLYYWYYGTIGLYQLQDSRWQKWNSAIQKTLLNVQRTDGQMAGSWDPETRWSCYGGRIYSTAMATLCLEVYYRYLPLYSSIEKNNIAENHPPKRR